MPDDGGPPPLQQKKPSISRANDQSFLWFDGILEGPVGDRGLLKSCTIRIGAIGIVQANLEIDGGRFSILLDDKSRRMDGIRDEQRARLLALFQEIVDLSPNPLGVESTLRCTEVTQDGVQETLFALQDGQFQRVSRTRKANSGDLSRKPRPISVIGGEFETPNQRRVILGVAVLFMLGFLGWQMGVVHLALTPEPQEISVNHGLFEDLIATDLSKKWGVYTLSIFRGGNFPDTMAAFDSAIKSTKKLDRGAMLNAVAHGDVIYVQLIDSANDIVFQKGLSLKPLLLSPENKIQMQIRGHKDAQSIRLALTPAPLSR